MSNQLMFNFTLEEAQYILNAISKSPYHEVRDLILKIQEQGNSQLQAQNEVKVDVEEVSKSTKR